MSPTDLRRTTYKAYHEIRSIASQFASGQTGRIGATPLQLWKYKQCDLFIVKLKYGPKQAPWLSHGMWNALSLDACCHLAGLRLTSVHCVCLRTCVRMLFYPLYYLEFILCASTEKPSFEWMSLCV